MPKDNKSNLFNLTNKTNPNDDNTSDDNISDDNTSDDNTNKVKNTIDSIDSTTQIKNTIESSENTNIENISRTLHKLQSIWTLWYHDPNNNNWDFNSYHEVISINSIEEYLCVFKNINEYHIQNGMFFLMRGYIRPIWEDEKNSCGGCRSYKVDKKDVYQVWKELGALIIGENILPELHNDENWDIVNGISISPKKAFSIIKIWINNYKFEDIIPNVKEIELMENKEGLFRRHQANIEKHNNRIQRIRENQEKNKTTPNARPNVRPNTRPNARPNSRRRREF